MRRIRAALALLTWRRRWFGTTDHGGYVVDLDLLERVLADTSPLVLVEVRDEVVALDPAMWAYIPHAVDPHRVFALPVV